MTNEYGLKDRKRKVGLLKIMKNGKRTQVIQGNLFLPALIKGDPVRFQPDTAQVAGGEQALQSAET